MSEITSLLFYAIADAQGARRHIARLTEALARGNYSHAIPPLDQRDFDDGEVKWMFDFSDTVANGVCNEVLSAFLETHEQFILDVLAVDPAVRYELSAQLSIDENIGAFELGIPRVPAKIAAYPSFRFSYFIWHVASESQAEERSSNRLQ